MFRVLFRRIPIVVSGLLIALACGGNSATVGEDKTVVQASPSELRIQVDRIVIGVTISETTRELSELFTSWETIGFNTVFVADELASSGGFRALAKKHGFDLFIAFPLFPGPEVLVEESDLRAAAGGDGRTDGSRVGSSCPNHPGFRNQRVKEAQTVVKRLRPEGLCIDFSDDFVVRDMVGPDHDFPALPTTCYCLNCLQGFANRLGVPLFSIPPQPERAAAWIERNASDEWARFKTESITSITAEIVEGARYVDPEITVNFNVVPQRADEFDGARQRFAGLDLEALCGHGDILSPMMPAFMHRRPPGWIDSLVRDLQADSGCPVLPNIPVSVVHGEDEVYSADMFEDTLREALESPSVGVVIRSWEDIEKDPGRAEMIRRVITDFAAGR